METLFDGIPLEKSLHLHDHQRHRRHLALSLRGRCENAKAPVCKKLSGTVQNDVLKEYIARGTYIYPVRPRHAHRH